MSEYLQEILVFLSVTAAAYYLLRHFGVFKGSRTRTGCAGSDCTCGPIKDLSKRRTL